MIQVIGSRSFFEDGDPIKKRAGGRLEFPLLDKKVNILDNNV